MAYGSITECINLGNIYANQSGVLHVPAGGIAGYGAFENNVTIINSYNMGNVTSYRMAGGIVGAVSGTNGNCVIQNCYSKGTISISSTLTNTYKGGILAYLNNTDHPTATYSLINNYYLSGCGASYGMDEDQSNTEATPKTYEQFQTLNTLGDAYILDEKYASGNWKYNEGYPILKWQAEE